MESQEKVWDNIAKEWSEFRKEPKELTIRFLKKQKGKILDLGSGSGRNLIKLKNAKMYEVDFSKKMLELGKQKAKKEKIKAEFIKATTTKIPFEDNFFDAALYLAALHCIETSTKRKKSIKELFRVLRPGAKTYISVWDFNSKRFGKKKERLMKWKKKSTRYYYFYSEKEVHELFKRTGFKIVSRDNEKGMIRFIVEKPKS